MAFPQSFLDELVSRSDIADVVGSYVQLTKRSGSNMFGLCPFHGEKTPSFSVSSDKQIYHCFGCGKGGGVINFIMEIENLSFPDAVALLAKRAGMTVPEDGDQGEARQRRRILDLNRDAARFFHAALSAPEGAEVAGYVARRGLMPSTVKRFGLGAAPDGWDGLIAAMLKKGYEKYDLVSAGLAVSGKNGGGIYDRFRNRLIFPVIDLRGEVVGFGSRVVNDSDGPKYLNSPESSVYNKRRILFGLNLAKNTRRANIILCEGNIDVISLHQAGFDNTVATMGTALTAEQARLISRYTKQLVVCYDNDEAGLKATQRAIGLLGGSDLAVKVLQLPNRIEDGVPVKQDPDDYIRAHGPEAFERLLNASENHIEYRLGALRAGFDLGIDEQKVEYLREASALIATLPGPVEREVYAARVAGECGVTPDAVKLQAEREAKRIRAAEEKKRERELLSPERTAQPRSRALRFENTRSALAEQGILRLLYLDPTITEKYELPDPELFSSEVLRKFYIIFLQRAREGLPIQLSLLSQDFTLEEMSLLTEITDKPESLSDVGKSLSDYINRIDGEYRRGDINEDSLKALQRELINKKGYGG